MERISYLDSAKGISMLLIVSMHLGIKEPWPCAYDIMVAIFFIISGCFFSPNSYKNNIIKKVKTLLVPFFIFYIFSYILFYVIKSYAPHVPVANAKSILDCFSQHEMFNGPLWFLPSLFFVNVISTSICYFFKVTTIRIILFVGIGLIGYELGMNNIYLPLGIDIALTALPFFYIGYECLRNNLFSHFEFPFSFLLIGILFILGLHEDVSIYMSINSFKGSYMSVILSVSMMSIALIILCKAIARYCYYGDVVFSYIGKHSLWILCSHHLVYRPFKMFIHCPYQEILIFCITIGICLVTAPIVEKYCPFILGKYKKY